MRYTLLAILVLVGFLLSASIPSSASAPAQTPILFLSEPVIMSSESSYDPQYNLGYFGYDDMIIKDYEFPYETVGYLIEVIDVDPYFTTSGIDYRWGMMTDKYLPEGNYLNVYDDHRPLSDHVNLFAREVGDVVCVMPNYNGWNFGSDCDQWRDDFPLATEFVESGVARIVDANEGSYIAMTSRCRSVSPAPSPGSCYFQVAIRFIFFGIEEDDNPPLPDDDDTPPDDLPPDLLPCPEYIDDLPLSPEWARACWHCLSQGEQDEPGAYFPRGQLYTTELRMLPQGDFYPVVKIPATNDKLVGVIVTASVPPYQAQPHLQPPSGEYYAYPSIVKESLAIPTLTSCFGAAGSVCEEFDYSLSGLTGTVARAWSVISFQIPNNGASVSGYRLIYEASQNFRTLTPTPLPSPTPSPSPTATPMPILDYRLWGPFTVQMEVPDPIEETTYTWAANTQYFGAHQMDVVGVVIESNEYPFGLRYDLRLGVPDVFQEPEFGTSTIPEEIDWETNSIKQYRQCVGSGVQEHFYSTLCPNIRARFFPDAQVWHTRPGFQVVPLVENIQFGSSYQARLDFAVGCQSLFIDDPYIYQDPLNQGIEFSNVCNVTFKYWVILYGNVNAIPDWSPTTDGEEVPGSPGYTCGGGGFGTPFSCVTNTPQPTNTLPATPTPTPSPQDYCRNPIYVSDPVVDPIGIDVGEGVAGDCIQIIPGVDIDFFGTPIAWQDVYICPTYYELPQIIILGQNITFLILLFPLTWFIGNFLRS